MYGKYLFTPSSFLSIIYLFLLPNNICAQDVHSQRLQNHQTVSADSTKEKKVNFTVRIGQGGFNDERSPIDKLGGGQLTLDIKPQTLPIAISISNEYYTNSADPTHSYEIANLTSINVLYMKKLNKYPRTNVFLGGGIGRLEVPKGEKEPDAMTRGNMYNLESGINVRLFWKVGFYGIYKYLHARKNDNGVYAIDFNEHVALFGFTINFSL